MVLWDECISHKNPQKPENDIQKIDMETQTGQFPRVKSAFRNFRLTG